MDVGSALAILIPIAVFYVFVGSILFKLIVEPALGNTISRKRSIWSFKETTKELDCYKESCLKNNQSLFVYWYLYPAYNHPWKIIFTVWLLIAVAAYQDVPWSSVEWGTEK